MVWKELGTRFQGRRWLKAVSLGDKEELEEAEDAALDEAAEKADMTDAGDEDGGVGGSFPGGHEAYGIKDEYKEAMAWFW